MNTLNSKPWFAIAVSTVLLAALLLITIPSGAPAVSAATTATYDWLQFNFNPQHSGNNTSETTITAANVNTLAKVYQVTLLGTADGAPVYLSGVTTASGIKDLVFITTKAGHIIALDAATGAQVWSHQNGPGTCKINNGTSVCYTTSSPALDPSRQYVYSYGFDVNTITSELEGRVHKYQVGDGTEITTGGWPELTTRKSFNEKGSPALDFATSNGVTYLYMANGGYPGDAGDYQGHITAINLATGAQKVFNAMCSNQAVHFVQTPGTPDCPDVQSAIWSRAAVIYSAATNKIYMSTGNGTFAPASHYWGDTVFALNPDGSGSNGDPLDTFTPANYATLQSQDADIGSTAPAILPVPATSNIQHLAVQSGKALSGQHAKLRLLNLDNMSGQSGIGHTGGEVGAIIDVPQAGNVLTQPAVWVDANSNTWVFIANDSGISGLKLVVDGSGNPSLSPIWQTANGGTSPIIANGVLYYASSNIIRALNPLTGAQLWSDSQISSIHWQSPIVVNGVLYITDQSSHLTAYALNGTIATPTPTITPTFGPSPTATLTSTPTLTPRATATPCSVRPNVPVLLSPAAGATVNVRNVPLDWNDAACARRYQVVVHVGSTSGAIVEINSSLTTSNYTTKSLTPGKTYFWHVHACNPVGCSNYSAWRKFIVSSSAAAPLNRDAWWSENG